MAETANAEQFEAWNGDGGHRWVARADERDRILAPVADALLAVANPSAGSRLLDVGCGCGATTLRTAIQVGDTGTVTGVDLSEPMLQVARQRARVASVDNVDFVQADAQTHGFEPGTVDLVISRFGTMFFSDSDAATATLRVARFRDITMDPVALMFTIGQSIDEAVEYLADSGPGRALLETIPEGTAKDAALADVRDSLVGHRDDSGVQLGGAIWIISAAR